MALVFNTILAGCAIGTIGAMVMLIRNEWVFKVQMRWVNQVYQENKARIAAGRMDLLDYDVMPDYDVMMKRWWCWRAERFVIDNAVKQALDKRTITTVLH